MPIPVRIALLTFSIVSATVGESLVFPPYLHSYGIRKATPKHLFMFFGFKTSFSDPQGLATARLDSWEDPKTEKDDDEVVVYGVNSGRGEIIYNTSMWGLGLYGSKGSGKEQLLFPKGIAADGRGNVYVADSGNGRVVRLFNPKSMLVCQGSFNGASPGDSGLRGPSRIGIDEKVHVYVADPPTRRIMVFDQNGKVLQSITGAGGRDCFIDGPTALAVADGKARWSWFSGESAIFCADKNGTRLWKIGFDGTTIARAEMPSGHAANYGAIDYYHNFWVTDLKNPCIVKFDHNLKLLDVFGSFGDGDNQFVEPRGIAIYKRFGQVFVAEKKGAQYFWMGTTFQSASLSRKEGGRYSLTVKATEYSLVSLFSAVKKDTVNYLKRYWISCGSATINFNSKEKEGIREQGLTLKMEPTYSSLTYNSWCYPLRVTEEK
jgi:hypothetical protein